MQVHPSKISRLVRVLAAVAAVASVTLAADVRAEDPGKEAEEHYLRGKTLLKTGDVKGAYLEYKASWDLKQSYDIAANLGNLELDQGMPRDAAEHLAFALRTVAVTVPQDRVEAMRTLFEKARRLVGAATVKVNVPGAEIFVDGQSIGRSPLAGDIFLDPGKRTIEARLTAYTPVKKVVEVTRSTTVPVELELVLAAPVSSAAPTTTSLPLPPPKSMVPVGIGAATAAAAIGVGVVGMVLSFSKGNEVSRLTATLNEADVKHDHSICASSAPPKECADLDSAFRGRAAYRNVSIVGFATAGAAALATVAWLVLPLPHPAHGGEKTTGVRASFGASPTGGSVTLGGQF